MKKMLSLERVKQLKQWVQLHKFDKRFLYIIPVVIVILGIVFSAKIFAEQNGSSPESGATSRLKAVNDSLVSLSYGSTSAGSWGDWGAFWNRIRSAGEWTPSGNAAATDVVAGKTFYANTRNQLTGTLVTQNYVNQALMDYDDWNCSGNNAESTTACAAGDSEYTGEESTWNLKASGGTAGSVTDNSITQTLSSNKVYQDTLTGLYWSDKAVGTMDNEFRYEDGDNRTTPTSTSCNFNSTGTANAYCDNQDPTSELTEDNDVSATEFCLNLQLDGDNADGDNNGLTGVETDWRLPTQKELMQAYIDGSANNLPNPDASFWSSTENYSSRKHAWYVHLHYGYTNSPSKDTAYSVRCVRRG